MLNDYKLALEEHLLSPTENTLANLELIYEVLSEEERKEVDALPFDLSLNNPQRIRIIVKKHDKRYMALYDASPFVPLSSQIKQCCKEVKTLPVGVLMQDDGGTAHAIVV